MYSNISSANFEGWIIWSGEVGVERVQQAWKQEEPPVLFQHAVEGEQGEDILLTSIFCSQEL